MNKNNTIIRNILDQDFKDYTVTFNAQYLFKKMREIDRLTSYLHGPDRDHILDIALDLQNEITKKLQEQVE